MKKKLIFFSLLILSVLMVTILFACKSSPAFDGNNPLNRHYNKISVNVFRDSINHARYEYKDYIPPYPVYTDDQIAGIAENFLYFQNKDGGWPKNVDWLRKFDKISVTEIKNKMHGDDFSPLSTLDNYSTFSQINYLALVYKQIPDKRYMDAVKLGIDWLFKARHPKSGGFSGADVIAVTYNDNVMSQTLSTLRLIAENDYMYGFLDQATREKARKAFDMGIKCILKTQIRVDGNLTVWCQQHDHETLEPIWGRKFEPPSMTASESVYVLRLLMSIDKPDNEIINAVKAGCEWLEKTKITGKKIERKPAPAEVLNGRYSDYENILIDDPDAPPIWAHFYDLKTEEPLFYDHDGTKVECYNDLSRERRVGYSYYGIWPAELLSKYYPEWEKKIELYNTNTEKSYNVKTIINAEDENGFRQIFTNDPKYYRRVLSFQNHVIKNEVKSVEVKVKKISGFISASYGLQFCYQNNYNFYIFYINAGTETYSLHKVINGKWYHYLYDGTWTDDRDNINFLASENLKSGYNAENTLKVVRKWNGNFDLYINGIKERTFIDKTFSGGDSGCIVFVADSHLENFPEIPVDVRYKLISSE